MKMIESEGNVDKQGQITVPAYLLSGIGLVPGDAVKIACISGPFDNPTNTLSEQKGITILEKKKKEEKEMVLPNELLEAANIPIGSDVEIVCTEGAIIITEKDLLNMIPDELCQLFAELNINPETVRDVIRSGGVWDGQ